MNPVLQQLGFDSIENVATLNSVANLFAGKKRRCGIYLLEFDDGLSYIGQAVDVVRRFAQHRKAYANITGFAFLPCDQTAMTDLERRLIQQAEAAGMRLRNSVHVTSVQGDRDIDLLVPEHEQRRFLESGPSCDELSGVGKIVLSQSHTDRTAAKFTRFLSHPLEPLATSLLGTYVRHCIVSPRLTEYSFWSASCMPSTNAGTWPRLFCVNAASMELFVCGTEKRTGRSWSFMTVADDVLEQFWPEPERLIERYPFLELIERGYRDAGDRQITLGAYDDAPMIDLLNDDGIRRAARMLALRVMRKRGNLYAKHHCQPMVDHALAAVAHR